MTTDDTAPAAAPGDGPAGGVLVSELKRGAVTLWEAVFQSFSFIGPAGDVAILLVGTALYAGGATPLAVLIAWIIYGLWMNTPMQFSKEIVNSGSFYAYSAQGLRGWGGVLALWYWIGENLTGPSFAVLGLGSFVYLLVSSATHSVVIWVVIAIAVLAYGVVLSYLGIKPSLAYTMWSGFLETAFLVITAVVIIIMAGGHNSGATFTLSPVGGRFHLLFLGVIFSVLDFTGLGTATTISEEAKDARRLIKRAIPLAWVLAGMALIIPSYALTVGWGLPHMASYAKSPDPGLIVYQRYLGRVGWALLIAFTINSYMMYMVAKVNAVTRTWFSGGRDGIIFKGLGKVHPRFRTPHLAIALFFVLVIVIDMVAGAVLGPGTGALWLLTISGICIIAVHIVGNFALTVFTLQRGRFRWLYHGLIPSVATVLGGIVLFYSVYPVPSEPTGSAVVVGLLWLLAGFFVAAYYVWRHPDLLKKAGRSRT